MALNPTDLKRALRARFRNRRKVLGKTERAAMNRELCRHLLASPLLKRCRQVAAFVSMDGEPDLMPALRRLSDRGIAVTLPVILPGRRLEFRHWNENTDMRANRFGIPEPAGGKAVALDKIDLVFLPVVGWDRQGRRLGMGGGYYDKAFTPLLGLDGPRRVGVAWSMQEYEDLPEQEWDVGLHDVLTEEGWFTCRE